jgi:Tol biopolymer transport system component
VDIVATTGSPFPGLSPDGRLLAFAEATGNRPLAVADLTGRRLTTFTLPVTETLQGWTGKSATLLTLSTGTIRRLRAVSVPDGQPRTLFETSAAFTLEPRWSPDGTTVSVMSASGDHCDLRIMQLDGSVKATQTLPGRCGTDAAWTPDQRSLVFTRYPQNGPPVVTALDVATGQTKDLRSQPAEMSWVLDRDVVVIAEIAGASRRVSFWQVDLEGKSTLLRELPFDEPPGSMAVPLDRSSALVWRSTPGEARFVALDGRSADRVVSPAGKGFVLPRPALSSDKGWVAFRINPSGNDSTRLNVVELVARDGAARHSVELPFFVQGADTLKILPGGKGFVVAERPSRGADAAIYLVDVATKASKKLFDYTPRGRLPELAPSPDGRTVLTLTTETLAPSITAMDLSGVK